MEQADRLAAARAVGSPVNTEWIPMPRHIVTERLELGTWSADDVDDYRALVRERDQRFPSAPHGDGPDRDEAIRVIERLCAAIDDTGIGLLVVRVDGRFAGYCGLVVGRSTLDEPEIAYELARRVHGNGYATEAARAVVAAAAGTGRKRLWATLREWNSASFRVLDKLGFERTDRHTSDDHGPVVWCTRLL